MALRSSKSHGMALQKTSSLSKFAICDMCGRREDTKQKLEEHVKDCESNRTCTWCNTVFKNRGNLFSHTLRIHGKKMSQTSNIKTLAPATYKCDACPKSYTKATNLMYHIRREHFNLTASVTEAEQREVNEVWVERVVNSDALVEITKVSPNKFVFQKVTATDDVKISEPKESIDLSHLYPTHTRKNRVWCEICHKTYYQQDFQKHIKEIHNISRNECNSCNQTFEQPSQYLQHVCEKRLLRNRKKVESSVTAP